MRYPAVSIAALLILAACSARAGQPGELVERYLAAYNDRDVAGMLEFVHPDIQWLSIAGDEVRVEADGAEALGESLRGYFEAVPSTRSSIEAMMVSGNRVSVAERARWESEAGPRSQTALSIYEIAEGRIRRVWYFSSD